MELLGKLSSNETSKIGMLPSVSQYVSNKFVENFIKTLNNKYKLKGIKGSKKCKYI